ncbi:glycosyltransferase [Microbacterium sp. LWO12-1.2]|uniref:glycosyltransferase n=1 Tax=Microbacterium sp. LWO12-1.2 TaxID=3135261 RepID=UPI0034400B92
MTHPPAAADFDHVILTRFSVRFPGSPPVVDDDWLFYRWAFFCDALASSVARQTVRTFQWLVFFDVETPAWLREEIDALSPGLFTPVYVSSWSSLIAQQAVAEVASAPYLITTRIDSDDAIARQFVADVQSHFDHQESLYINLLCGIQVERTGEVYRYDEPSNPFISYVEKRVEHGLPRTVFYSLRHVMSRANADVLNVVGAPRWMQIIHGSNIANSVRGVRVRPERYEADFDLELAFSRTVSGTRYLRERIRSILDLARLWIMYPHYVREFRYARRLYLAGTTVLPREDIDPNYTPSAFWRIPGSRPLFNLIRKIETARRLRRNRLSRET